MLKGVFYSVWSPWEAEITITLWDSAPGQEKWFLSLHITFHLYKALDTTSAKSINVMQQCFYWNRLDGRMDGQMDGQMDGFVPI